MKKKKKERGEKNIYINTIKEQQDCKMFNMTLFLKDLRGMRQMALLI